MYHTAFGSLPIKKPVNSVPKWHHILVEQWHLIASVLSGIFIMLPRLISPQFGLLDDGLTLETVQSFQSGEWSFLLENSVGRFRPLYWIYHYFLYNLGGLRPVVFFIGNLILLLSVVIGLISIVRRSGGSKLQAFLCSVAFLASSAFIENAYTLSKPELLQSLLLVLWVNLLQKHENLMLRNVPAGNFRERIIFDLQLFVLTLCICLTKETGLVLAPIILLFFVLHRPKISLQAPGIVLLACGLYLIMRSVLVTTGVGSGEYVQSFTLNPLAIVSVAFRWSSILLHDYLFLLIAIGLWVFLQKSGKLSAINAPLIYALLWMTVWLGVYLPWLYTSQYYLLPFSLGAAVFTGLVIGRVWEFFPAHRWLWILYILFWMVTPIHAVFNARTQIAADNENWQVMAYVAEHAKKGQTVLINYQPDNEYIEEIGKHLALIWNRPDIRVMAYSGTEFLDPDLPAWVLSNIVEDAPVVSVRLGCYEDESREFQKRLQKDERFHKEIIWQDSTQFNGVDIDLGRFPGIILSSQPSIVEVLHLKYGWTITQLN